MPSSLPPPEYVVVQIKITGASELAFVRQNYPQLLSGSGNDIVQAYLAGNFWYAGCPDFLSDGVTPNPDGKNIRVAKNRVSNTWYDRGEVI